MTKITSAYCHAPLLHRALVAARPFICPSEPILSCVPKNASVLDVGCGVGALLVLLAMQGKITSGVGCDANPSSIRIAKKAASTINSNALQFYASSTIADIPTGNFDALMLIDVMHHIPPSEQEEFFSACISRLSDGGIFIYKDMVNKPLWKNLFNRLHDLVLARQIIHYVPLDNIKSWANENNLRLEKQSLYSRFAYGHELLVFQKQGKL